MSEDLIRREITFKSPRITHIEYVQGVNTVPIEFSIIDYPNIPYNSTAEFWVTKEAVGEHNYVSGKITLPIDPDEVELVNLTNKLTLRVRIVPPHTMFRYKGDYFGTLIIKFPNGKSLCSYPIMIKVYEDSGDKDQMQNIAYNDSDSGEFFVNDDDFVIGWDPKVH